MDTPHSNRAAFQRLPNSIPIPPSCVGAALRRLRLWSWSIFKPTLAFASETGHNAHDHPTAPSYFNPSKIFFASFNRPITSFFSSAEFQSGYCEVASIVCAIHAAKYSASFFE